MWYVLSHNDVTFDVDLGSYVHYLDTVRSYLLVAKIFREKYTFFAKSKQNNSVTSD